MKERYNVTMRLVPQASSELEDCASLSYEDAYRP
jgi:hypothetical protein